MEIIKIVELIGNSKKDWEDAAQNAVKEASKTIDGITGLEVIAQTAKVKSNKIIEYKTNVKVAFKVKDKR